MEDKNRLIAKNTMVLYIRMLILMFVSFYTSRVILNALGVVDYGIYNVVGGIVGSLAFLNSSLSIATHRYLAFALGKNKIILLEQTFSMSFIIHGLFSIIIVLLAETIGLWYFSNYLNIPTESYVAAMCVYQISVVSCVISIISVPFTALVITYERMGIYAWISLLEGFGKLLIAFLIAWITYDKLQSYAFLLLLLSCIVFSVWFIYCKRRFSVCNFKLIWDNALFCELVQFIGWQFLGSVSWMLRNQGVSLVLNLFFGPILNASRAIAIQVNAGIVGFVNNFQTAINPQIIKTYASNQFEDMYKLIIRSSKFSYLLLLIFAIPVFIETENILKFWLKDIPDYSVILVQWMLIATMFDMLSGTLQRGALATSNIRKYQVTITSILIGDVFFVYACFKIGLPPEWMYIVECIIYFISLFVRLYLVKEMIGLSEARYLKDVVLRALIVTVPSFLLSKLLFNNIHQNIIGVLTTLSLSFITTLSLSLFIGFTKNERRWAYSTILSKFSRKNN